MGANASANEGETREEPRDDGVTSERIIEAAATTTTTTSADDVATVTTSMANVRVEPAVETAEVEDGTRDPSTETFSVTTAINYANGAPHMGHAYESVSTDVLARYHRAYGRKVLFQTGSDEHGQKIAEAAEVAGVAPLAFVDGHVEEFRKLNERLSVSNDVYNRTTSEAHKKACAELFRRSRDNGDIYLDTYEGWYNVREETFVTESEAQASGYKDPVSGKDLKKMKEESYFFKQSRYQAQLIAHIESHPEFIQPSSRRNEILARLQNDELRDLSVSRTTFDWGIPVPDAPKHVMYVWFDALTNYLTGTGWPEETDKKDFWPASVHIIGKDIIWFHCVIWPCMLWSAGLQLPKTVFGHGFVTAEDGQKMSKSIGNVVDPNVVLEKFSSDTFRYYLMRCGVYGSDIPFSEAAMVSIHNADLADVIGNLVHRVTNLCNKSCGGVVPDCATEDIFDVLAVRARSEAAMAKFNIQAACEAAIEAVKATNKYLTDAAPWAVKGEGAEERKAVIIRSTIEAVYVSMHFLQPYIPTACEAVFNKLGTAPKKIWELKPFGENVATGAKVTHGDILFAKFEAEKKEIAKKEEPAPKPKPVPADAPVDVSRLELVVGTVKSVKRHPDADSLYVEEIDLGDEAPRQVVSGLVKHISEEDFTGLRVLCVANMKPSKMRGVESTAMVLCGTNAEGKTEPVSPPEGAANGTRVKCEGFNGEPDPVLNPKKKVFEAVSADFSINGDGVPTYKGVPFTAAEGPCTLPTIRDGVVK
ncbi:Aminoacyl-tRNA synthetase, class 1a,anticodon-binding [Ostreococcus tauri]|uniref:methionine--tRNA ligase n=1 Tax=Ostreococcus tauri TaxID=70448 RepID=A0A090M087_OSTTA|nr:Aminoacyl-tRNA synthetase, class 1a,anticodon-binding [Ostreococcus tauri]CEF97591.1 Aminoacyl-tRNA synthetase, class 1a,anticodon-binding [Ostreococcus tauri]|eukprot:XP_022838773.1 Aminoacyl-tRNA synthetase, class 1a,anticodon-binding [Ostreococcus tauri]